MKTIVLVARVLVVLILALVILRFSASAQGPQQPDMTIDAATRSAVIETLIKELNDGYIFPETAKRMEADLRGRIGNKEYDSITSAKGLAEKLTADAQSISKDKHLRVRYSFQPIPVRKDKDEPTAEEKAQFETFNKRVNFGFEKLERMQGNIGYVDLRGFMDPQAGAETVASAMGFLANTDILIFDLRQNGGGDPNMIALISSYLFGDKPVHLNDMYFREGNRTEEFWTKPENVKRHFGDKEIYVLTSSRTFSGAEEFANNMKVLKRATLIGETTGGGANPGGTVRLTEHFGAFLPVGRAVNPITKTNWEGVGVEPDIKAPKEQALKIAYIMALNKQLERAKDEDLKGALKDLIEQNQKELDTMKNSKE
jgi:C-terminal processing protease CtpA/Prc